MKKMKVWILLFGFIPSFLFSQDFHYWTNQFGTRSFMLSGAAVSGVYDNSSLYYNPGSLGLIDSGGISISGSLYKTNTTNFSEGAGPGFDVKSNNFQTLPLMVSGLRKFSKIDRLSLGYGVLQKTTSKFNSTVRQNADYNIIDEAESPGAEEFIGQHTITHDLNETQFALAVAYKLSDEIGIGLTNFVTLRNQLQNQVFFGRVIPNPGGNMPPPLSTDVTSYYYYTHYRYTLKLGFSLKKPNWGLGISVTTPSLSVGGSATLSSDITVQNLDFFDVGIRSSFIANDRQVKLKPTYKSPWSVSGGLNYDMGKNRFFASAEYFGKISSYSVIEPEPDFFVRPPDTSTQSTTVDILRVTDAHRSLVNVALGYELDLSKTFTFSLSGRTDFTYLEQQAAKQNRSFLGVITWSVYHLTGGLTWHRNRQDMSIGFQYSFGNGESPQFVNLDTPKETNFFVGDIRETNGKLTALGLAIGYTYYFHK